MHVHEIFGRYRPWDKEQPIRLYSDKDPGILLLICLFTICKIVLFYYCSLVDSTIMLTVLVTSPTSIICTTVSES